MMDFALPYMVQVVREYTTRVQELEQKQDKMADKTEDLNQLNPTTGMGGYDMGMGQMALMGPGMGPMGGVGMMSGGGQYNTGETCFVSFTHSNAGMGGYGGY